MGVNIDRPHLYVLPEDEADRQLANGFHQAVNSIRQMQVLRVVGGWRKVLDCFKSDHIKDMENNSKRFMVLLIDFDEKEDRLESAKAAIPDHLADRVFVLGAWSEPETLGHDLLKHNAGELDRLRERVRPILFHS